MQIDCLPADACLFCDIAHAYCARPIIKQQRPGTFRILSRVVNGSFDMVSSYHYFGWRQLDRVSSDEQLIEGAG